MMTEASNDKDMYIDWDKVHSGDELETQRAIESVEALCWWALGMTPGPGPSGAAGQSGISPAVCVGGLAGP